jgi:hypothetical protein
MVDELVWSFELTGRLGTQLLRVTVDLPTWAGRLLA